MQKVEPGNTQSSTYKTRWVCLGIAFFLPTVIILVIVLVVVFVVARRPQHANSGVVSPYANLTRMQIIDDYSLSAGRLQQRVFVIGDVHGCLNELNALINKIQYNPQTDYIILAGDLVAKGPDSLGVIRRAKQLGARCVRGNHDDKVIRFKTFYNANQEITGAGVLLPEGSVADPLKLDNYHGAIAREMTDADYDYLVSCPMILVLPSFQAVVVHAGLDPAKSLPDQDPYWVMNMRAIDSNGVPSRHKSGKLLWDEAWNEAQRKRGNGNATKVYYGHEASRGLQLKDYSFGLDTGCVYGNQLTALEITSGRVTQVPCHAYTTHA